MPGCTVSQCQRFKALPARTGGNRGARRNPNPGKKRGAVLCQRLGPRLFGVFSPTADGDGCWDSRLPSHGQSAAGLVPPARSIEIQRYIDFFFFFFGVGGMLMMYFYQLQLAQHRGPSSRPGCKRLEGGWVSGVRVCVCLGVGGTSRCPKSPHGRTHGPTAGPTDPRPDPRPRGRRPVPSTTAPSVGVLSHNAILLKKK